jgi:hypothetical protein
MPQPATAASRTHPSHPAALAAVERDPGSVSTSQDPPPVPPKDGDRDWQDKDPGQVPTTQTPEPVPPKDGKGM